MNTNEQIINELQSLLALFKELNSVDKEQFQIPMSCFKKVVNSKLKNIKDLVKYI